MGGLTFEHEAIMRLIAKRCNRLIVIASPNFLKSEANKFFVTFATALGIGKCPNTLQGKAPGLVIEYAKNL